MTDLVMDNTARARPSGSDSNAKPNPPLKLIVEPAESKNEPKVSAAAGGRPHRHLGWIGLMRQVQGLQI